MRELLKKNTEFEEKKKLTTQGTERRGDIIDWGSKFSGWGKEATKIGHSKRHGWADVAMPTRGERGERERERENGGA